MKRVMESGSGWTLMVFLVLLLVCSSCGSGKDAVTEATKAKVDQMIANREFEFTGQWAMPLSGNDMNQLWNAGLLPPGDTPNRINLIGNYNFLKVNRDSVSAYLPFFGGQQFNVNVNSRDQAIQFEEEVTDLQVTYDERKERYDIRFSASKGQHGYVLFLTVLSNATATLRVNSSTRDNISYQGSIKALSPEEVPD